MGEPIVSRRPERLEGHKCLGAVHKFEVNCECGWVSCPHRDRGEAYSEWRGHVLSHGGELEPWDRAEQRQRRAREKLFGKDPNNG